MRKLLIFFLLLLSLATWAQVDTTVRVKVPPGPDTTLVSVRVKLTTNVSTATATSVTQTTLPTVPPASNRPPVANAGADVSMVLPANSTILNGSASVDPDGSIKSYLWTSVGGPTTFTLANPASATTNLSNLVRGSYAFRLQVTDNQGATASDDVQVTVNDAPTPPAGRQHLTFEEDFEGSNPLSNFYLGGHQYCCDYSITVVPAPDGDGHAAKYDLRKGDPIVSSSKRAELEFKQGAPETSERWYGFRYWLSNYAADDGAESLVQFHDQDGTTPPLSLQVQSGRLRIMQSFTSGNLPWDFGPVVSNQWISVVIHVKWTSASSGTLEAWRDGTLMVAKYGVRTNSSGGSYEKLGINKWSWAPGGGTSTTSQRIFYIDKVRIGDELATYNDVKP